MKVILGLNWGHDGAAAIVRDGRLECAVSLERITRKKKDSGISSDLLSYVFDLAGIKAADVSARCSGGFHTLGGESRALVQKRGRR